jgi:hypothetical protein
MQHKKPIATFSSELSFIINQIYVPHGLTPQNIALEAESREYNATTFEIADKKIIFRTAKITPTKVGQFVTLWKRIGGGPIMPFDASDHFDFCIISVRKGSDLGQFIFPKEALATHDVISREDIGGKRAMRVYPPWDMTDNQQAKRTQAWQRNYFVNMNVNEFDDTRLKELLGL